MGISWELIIAAICLFASAHGHVIESHALLFDKLAKNMTRLTGKFVASYAHHC